MSATPEAMLFTWEFDASAQQAHSPARTPTIAPSLLAQLAEASRQQAPVTPIALPNEVNMVIRDPEGDIRVTVGREAKDVAVHLEVPAGLMAAVTEAEAPIRVSLNEEGYQLEDYEVAEREDGVERQPDRERARQRGQRPRRDARHSREEQDKHRPTSNTGWRLLDRRA